MNSISTFIHECKKHPGVTMSLRRVFPGRGNLPTKQRAEVKQFFIGASYAYDGVVYDSKAGVFVAAVPSTCP